MSHPIIDKKQAAGYLTGCSDLFVRIQNPSTVYPPYEICPIALPLMSFLRPPAAAVMDMDGTTTTTETLCLHSLEFAVRAAMGAAGADWKGLDPDTDYPNVIGNSTTRHVEYLVDAYGQHFDADALGNAFLKAAKWTLKHGRDEQRKQQVEINLRLAGVHPSVLESDHCGSEYGSKTTTVTGSGTNSETSSGDGAGTGSGTGSITSEGHPVADPTGRNEEQSGPEAGKTALRIGHPDLITAACIDIYYQRYHEILAAIERGDRAFLQQIPGLDSRQSFIEPMPAVALTLALLKGDLGSEAELIPLPERTHPGNPLNEGGLPDSSQPDSPMPENSLNESGLPDSSQPDSPLPDSPLPDSPLPDSPLPDSPHPDTKTVLRKLGLFFQNHPQKLALVTSSIRYEADIVMQEVFRSIRKETASWPVSAAVKTKLEERFRHPQNCYDSIVTADDSSEMRLKPHRDLYSIALQQIGIPPDEYDRVIGFEDSDSGTVAIRAAGIGRCIALPFHETSGHAFDAASVIARGGLPEVLARHCFFLDTLFP